MALLSKTKLMFINEAMAIKGNSEAFIKSVNDAIIWYFLGS